jgi:hypothetical protein
MPLQTIAQLVNQNQLFAPATVQNGAFSQRTLAKQAREKFRGLFCEMLARLRIYRSRTVSTVTA